MKENRTRIAIILDRSGSMESVRESTVTGFNEFIRKQREVGGDVSVKLVQFDDQYDVVFDKPLAEVPELTQATFVPRGWTALYDAQGKTIVTLGEELEKTPESERPSKVIVMTLTDGQENQSKEYKLSDISKMIKAQQEKYNWEFIFLGANQDAVKTAATMNIPLRSSMTYTSNAQGMQATMAAASNYVSLARSSDPTISSSAFFSAVDRKAALGGEEDDSPSSLGGQSGGVLGNHAWFKTDPDAIQKLKDQLAGKV